MDASLVITPDCHAAAGRLQGLDWPRHRALRRRGAGWAMLGSLVLLGAYLGLVGWANSLAHAMQTLVRLWPWMLPLITGFGLQVGLFAYLRGAARATGQTHAGGVLASGGAGTVSMAACCVHHVTDVLPALGLAGAGLFLSTYQPLFLRLGVVSNALGTLYLLSLIGRHRLAPATGSLLTPALRLSPRQWRRMLAVAAVVAAGLLAASAWSWLA